MNPNKGAEKGAASLQQFAADFFKKPDFTVFLSAASLQQMLAAPFQKTLILWGFYSLPRGGGETLRSP